MWFLVSSERLFAFVNWLARGIEPASSSDLRLLIQLHLFDLFSVMKYTKHYFMSLYRGVDSRPRKAILTSYEYNAPLVRGRGHN